MTAWNRPCARLSNLAPGLLLSLAISAASIVASDAQSRLLGTVPIDTYVGAIILGALLRTVWEPGPRFHAGVHFSAKTMLETGVALLGAAIGVDMLEDMSTVLVFGIALLVAVAVGSSYAISRSVGLSSKLSIMIACGNSICGNSAIAAVAPVIEAEPEDMSAAIAFTAVWGIPLVIVLPLAARWIGWRPESYGAFAGLTIYSVPQVIAATKPLGAVAAQIGTLVKLVRIVMLAPVVFVVSLIFRPREKADWHRLLLPPWFIVAFFALMFLRSAGLIPNGWIAFISSVSNALTLVAMAALGLGSDAKLLVRSSRKVTIAVIASTILLSLLSAGVVSLS